jgi:hypothetical protein
MAKRRREPCRTCGGRGRLDNAGDILGTETCPSCAGRGVEPPHDADREREAALAAAIRSGPDTAGAADRVRRGLARRTKRTDPIG